MIPTRLLRIWTQFKEHRNRDIFLIKMNKIKKSIDFMKSFIVQYSIHRKDIESTKTKIHLTEHNKKETAEFKHTKH